MIMEQLKNTLEKSEGVYMMINTCLTVDKEGV